MVAPDDHGVPRRFSRLSDVLAYRKQLGNVIRLPDLAGELGVRYDELYRSMRHLGRRPAQHATSNEFTLTRQEADALRGERDRVRALHRRSAKLAEVARQLKLSFTTVRLMAINGDLDLDPETDTSGAKFVTRTSVERCWILRSKRRGCTPTAAVPFGAWCGSPDSVPAPSWTSSEPACSRRLLGIEAGVRSPHRASQHGLRRAVPGTTWLDRSVRCVPLWVRRSATNGS